MRPYVVFSCRLIAATAIWSIFESGLFNVLFRNPRTGVIENSRTRYQGPLNSNFDRPDCRCELEFWGVNVRPGKFWDCPSMPDRFKRLHFEFDRLREQNIVFEVNVLMDIALKLGQPVIKRCKTRAGSIRQRIVVSDCPHSC